MQGGTPESADEHPTADEPEEADAILAAPSSSAASLFFYRALPLLGVESPPTYPHGTRVLRATSPPPPGPLSDTSRRPRDQFRAEPLGWRGGEFSSRTVLATLTPFRRSYFPLLQQSKLKRLPGNCVWIKPHLKEKGGE